MKNKLTCLTCNKRKKLKLKIKSRKVLRGLDNNVK